MGISYNRLWKLLIDRGMTKTELRRRVGFTTTALAKMNRGEPVHLSIIESICKEMDCRVEEVLEITRD